MKTGNLPEELTDDRMRSEYEKQQSSEHIDEKCMFCCSWDCFIWCYSAHPVAKMKLSRYNNKRICPSDSKRFYGEGPDSIDIPD